MEVYKSLHLGKRIASLGPRGWVGPLPSSGAGEHPLHPRGPLAGCWMTARHVPAGDVAVATGCDFSACNATTVRETQGNALVTSEAGGRWPRPVCHPRGLGSLPGRVPASTLRPPRASPCLSSSAHGSFPPPDRAGAVPAQGSLLAVPCTMSSRAPAGGQVNILYPE